MASRLATRDAYKTAAWLLRQLEVRRSNRLRRSIFSASGIDSFLNVVWRDVVRRWFWSARCRRRHQNHCSLHGHDIRIHRALKNQKINIKRGNPVVRLSLIRTVFLLKLEEFPHLLIPVVDFWLKKVMVMGSILKTIITYATHLI